MRIGITSSGANTITVRWNSATDVPTANLGTAQLRITPYDGIEAGSTSTSANFTLDNVVPASLASFASSANTSTTVTLGWTPATDTNFNHYEIWYGTSQSDVEGRTGTASEWDNSDDAALATALTATTTITGLSAAQTYYMKIWAIDNYGNSTTLSTITVNNNGLPTASTLTAAQTTTGNGLVNISFIADDSDDDDTLQYKLEYNVGSGWTKSTVLETSGTGSTYGRFNVENDNTYQIGNSNGYVTSSSGANTITVIWDAQTNLGTTDIANAQVRLTPYDGTETGSVLTSSAFTLDQVAPSGGLTSLTGTNAADTSFTFGWDAITSESNFNKYQIYYKLSDAELYGLYTELTSMSTALQSLNGLTIGETYNIYIKALDDFGNSKISSILNIQLPDSRNPIVYGGGSGINWVKTAVTDTTDQIEIDIEIPPQDDGSDTETGTDSAVEEFEQEWTDQVEPQIGDHWAEPYLKDFFETTLIAEILQGDTEETQILSYLFDPEEKMTRVEFLKSSMDILSIDSATDIETIPFSDMTSESDYIEYVMTAYNVGAIEGYEDGTFRPDEGVNRAEALKIISKLTQTDTVELYGNDLLDSYGLPGNPFPDTDMNEWYAPYIIYAYSQGIVSGYGDGYFRPENNITLGEMAKILVLVVKLGE